MIYRILIDREDFEDFLDRLVPTNSVTAELLRHLKAAGIGSPRMQGASYSALAAVMAIGDECVVRRQRHAPFQAAPAAMIERAER
jgi:hypothetical protein